MFNHKFYSISSKKYLKALLFSISTISAAWADEHVPSQYIAPPMVNIPAGDFMMGTESGSSTAKPIHRVTVAAFQMAKYHVTVAEFKKFALDTGYIPDTSCNDYMNERWFAPTDKISTSSWDKHRFQTNDYQPVTCVSWQSVNAYAKWLSDKTGTHYRLPNEQEWEYAVKANTTSRYFWGDDIDSTQACLYGNFADHSGEYFASKQYGASYVGFIGHVNCDDGEAYNSIVGLYRPNPFGLFDMVGNVLQYTASCFYPGYQEHTKEELDSSQCENIALRGSSWHNPPNPHAGRNRVKREDSSSWALSGFRLATDGHHAKTELSTAKFETALKQAQATRLATRPKLPAAPKYIQLVQVKDNIFKLSWQRNKDADVTGYEIYQSNSPHTHKQGQFFKRHYEEVHTLDATRSSIEVTLPSAGGSFRVVTVTDNFTSLPSLAAAFLEPKTLNIPGKINVQDAIALENVHLRHIKAKDDKPEAYYLLKLNGRGQHPLATATFKVKVQKSAWYRLNYRAKSRQTGVFFSLWQNNTLLAKISYDPKVDDKTSNRYKVFLEKGTHTLQVSVVREGFDYWSMDWLEFSEEN